MKLVVIFMRGICNWEIGLKEEKRRGEQIKKLPKPKKLKNGEMVKFLLKILLSQLNQSNYPNH